MPILETLAITVGPAIAKTLVKLWFKDSKLGMNVSLSLVELFTTKTKDELAKRRARRQFEMLGEQVAESLEPVFRQARLQENSQNAVALAVADTLNNTPLDISLLIRQNLDATKLANYLLKNAENKKLIRDFSSVESALYERTIRQLTIAVVDIASELPQFQERSFAELLKGQGLLIGKTNEILEELRDFRIESQKVPLEVTEHLIEIKQLLKPLRTKSVNDAFTTEITRQEDREKVSGIIHNLEIALDKAGAKRNASTWYSLGIAHITLNELDKAEASLLEATNVDTEMGSAYFGLAMIYQLRSHDLILNKHFQLAQQELDKAERYSKKALQYNTENSTFFVQLGYVHKELAEYYISQNRKDEAEQFLDKAMSNFKMTLGLSIRDASAHNGIGNVYLLRGDYDQAIEWSKKATELAPRYLFAFLDLAMAYYGKARTTLTKQEMISTLSDFQDALRTITQLNGTDAGRLPSKVEQDLAKMENWMIWRENSL